MHPFQKMSYNKFLKWYPLEYVYAAIWVEIKDAHKEIANLKSSGFSGTL